MNMRTVALLFVVIVLSSCDSFYHLRYRSLKKVPASPVVFAVPPRNCIVPDAPVVLVEHAAQEETLTFSPACDSSTGTHADVLSPSPAEEKRSGEIQPVKKEPHKQPLHHVPARRDFSFLIGVLLILVGLYLLSVCIFFLPFSGMAIIPLILLELLFAYITWRALGTGITYVISRFRKRKNNRKES